VADTEFRCGAGVDRAKPVQALPQLPDTADELNAVTRELGVAVDDIHLGSDAGEATPTKFDYGLLAASEVVQLKLDADRVVLSARNTIAGAKPGAEAEALSGLARSFFFTGARALLSAFWGPFALIGEGAAAESEICCSILHRKKHCGATLRRVILQAENGRVWR